MLDIYYKFRKLIFSKEFLRFFVTGLTATFVDFTLLLFLIYVLKFNPEYGLINSPNIQVKIYFANVISFCTGMFFGFAINKYWTFRHIEGSKVNQGAKYATVSLFNLIVNNLIYGFLIPLGVIPPIAKVIATGIQMLWTYFLYKFIVFKK